MSSLIKLSAEELKDYLPASDISSVEQNKESVYKIENLSGVPEKIDPLINVEISLRGGERVGLFAKENGKKC